MSWFSSQFNRWSDAAREGAASVFGPEGTASSSAAEVRRVDIVWGKQHLQVVLPRAVQPPTLRNLKDELATLTAVPSHQQKLIWKGQVLKDDRVPLSAFGIREGSRLTLIGTAGGVNTKENPSATPAGRLAAEEAERAKRAREADDSEEGLMRRIEQCVNGVDEDLLPEIEQLERGVTHARHNPAALPTPPTTASVPRPGATPSSTQGDRPSPTATAQPAQANNNNNEQLDTKQLTALHRKLSEFLLRALLALDTIPINSDTQRAARKAAVRKVQSYLDRVDHAWESYKSNPATAAQL
ncbi:hypothetical protein A4X06_0g1130 [Tilletia controversa]|uniref:BAG domain-containing protein n=1 Tax=Tilletia controversa TaxID=13291 RepID=A0A8X7T031_9BASI|nr:hypothetical protein CF328_g1006 [Tilletia controversa]KAE8253975.1 hypothetical protein A4X06_0g1130 [Tilletia controversa]